MRFLTMLTCFVIASVLLLVGDDLFVTCIRYLSVVWFIGLGFYAVFVPSDDAYRQ